MGDVEIVRRGDGSTDALPEIVRRFERAWRLLRKPNGGQASAFNLALLRHEERWSPCWMETIGGASRSSVGRSKPWKESRGRIVGHGQFESYCDGRPMV